MFRTKSLQKTIFDHDVYLPDERIAALKKSWAGPFREKVLPLIDEEPFRGFYHPDNGRPNVPVITLIAASVLKEMHNLTDLEVLGALEFDLRWHYALDIHGLEAHVCQKTLHNFRTLVCTNDKARDIFTDMTGKMIRAASLSTGKQRLDSTQITSNMAHLSRLGLFTRTIEGFLRSLEKHDASLYERLPKVYRKVYRERTGYFADVKSSKAKRRLAKCARHLFDLVDRFRGDPEIARLKSYRLMSRLLDEQCEVAQAEAPKVTLKKPEDIPGDSLQNPSDPDAAYGHKGKGYKASLTETCAEENLFQVITDVWVDGANASDQKDVPKVIERLDEADTKPEELFADAGYGSGENIVVCREHEVTLTAPNTLGKKPDINKVQLSDFEVGEDGILVTSCIKGQVPLSCTVSGKGKTVVAVFPKDACLVCEFLPICPVKRIKAGKYRLRFTPEAMATSKRKQEQEGKDFKERYKIRSGIEATISEAARLTGLKRVWCRGLSRVRAAVSFKALAINIKRYIAAELEKAARGQSGGAPGLHFRLFRVLVMVQHIFRCQFFAQAV